MGENPAACDGNRDCRRMSIEPWQLFAEKRIKQSKFVPYTLDFDRQSPEMIAHMSLEAYLDYYVRRPGGGAKPWALLTLRHKPEVIVEFGSALGIRTNLIAKLNPKATFHTVEIQNPYPASNYRLPPAYMAAINDLPILAHSCRSFDLNIAGNVNLCFIDADHSTESVVKDSEWAFAKKDDGNWRIVWDDYPLLSVREGVDSFCKNHGLTVSHEFGYASVGTE